MSLLLEQTDTLEPSAYAALGLAVFEGLVLLVVLVARRARSTQSFNVTPVATTTRSARLSSRDIP